VIAVRLRHSAAVVTIKDASQRRRLRPISPGKLIEPLCELFKDEVRQVAGARPARRDRGPASVPRPGLAIRVLGPVTAERLDLPAARDAIYIEEIRGRGGCTTRSGRLRGAAPDQVSGG